MNITGVIFDADGTLLDSMGIWENLGERYLKTKGIQAEKGLSEILYPMSMAESCAYLKAHYALSDSVDSIHEDLLALLRDFYLKEVELKPGVTVFLEKLKARKIPMMVATSNDSVLLKACFERLGINLFFNDILSCKDLGISKTQAAFYLKAAAQLGSHPETTVVFEDALFAVEAAKKAGMRTVALEDDSNLHERAKLENAATVMIPDFTDDVDIEDMIDKADKQGDRKMKTALSIAGSDSGGGAGIQADLKTMIMNGVYGMSVITALTAQNTTGVRDIQEVSPEFLKNQIDAVFEDIFPDAVKIGMVASTELIEVIGERLRFYEAKNIVVDPVMIATSGAELIKKGALRPMETCLFSQAKLITPNIPEAEVLSEMAITTRTEMEIAAERMGKKYGCAVLLKGGHCVNDASDVLFDHGDLLWFEGKHIDNPNTHGTGCTLSSAIAANLAKGFSLASAIRRAKEYLSDALSAQLDLGKGSGPLYHHFDLKGRYAEVAVKEE